MRLSNACKQAGGYYDPSSRTCKLGDNYIREIDPVHYEIVTPVGSFQINGYTPRVAHGVFFPFNNCGVEVTKDAVSFACYAMVEDGKYGAAFETTFQGELVVRPRVNR